MNELSLIFSTLFDRDSYPFQLSAAEQLLLGHNVVLQAPTGAGKTYGAIFPFLYAKMHQIPFADRLIYALPQRTLAVALYIQVKDLLHKSEKLSALEVKIQTGAMPEDSLFEADVVFTTIDQLLSAYIGVPVSLPRKLANLPAGAILGSYVVFDEFHLLEPGRALATALDLADRLSKYTRLLLMSATVPEQPLRRIAERAQAIVVQVTADQLGKIKSQQNKERRFITCDQPLSAQDILDKHEGKTIAVVNRVERAQELFSDLQRLATERGITDRLLLLHARFLFEDRQRIEQEIIGHFKAGSKSKAILIATQVIEVGLDISCTVMHTELAPANSIFQRSGRCARYEGEKGIVYVYQLPLTKYGKPRYGPYLKEEIPLVDDTGRQLAQRNNWRIDFLEEKAIVNAVHEKFDMELLRGVSAAGRRSEIDEAMRTGTSDAVRQLIRQVDSVNVLIHDQPDTLRLDRRPQSFSINRGVMEGFIKSLDLTGTDKGSLQVPMFDPPGQGEGEGENAGLHWGPVADIEQCGGALYIAIAPTHAHYNPDIGLTLGRSTAGTDFRSQEMPPRHDPSFEPYSYVRETYKEHVTLVIQQHDQQRLKCRVGHERLAHQFGLSDDQLESLSRLVAAFHDTAKLADKWQNAIWQWQIDEHHETRNGFLAHSQFDGTNRRQREKQKNSRYKRPPHAVESACAALPILAAAVRDTGIAGQQAKVVTNALISAIARHHSAFSKQLEDFALSPDARAEALRVAGLAATRQTIADHPPEDLKRKFGERLAAPTSKDAFLLYWYIARRLRIADQQATSMAGKQ